MAVRWLYSSSSRRGFMLLECAVAIVIIGVGVVAVAQLFATCTISNSGASSISTATFLANNAHELILSKPLWSPKDGKKQFGPTSSQVVTSPTTMEMVRALDNITAFNGAAFNPPVDADGNPLDGSDDENGNKRPDLSAYTQQITIEPMDTTDKTHPWKVATLPTTPPAEGYSVSVVRIKVAVSRTSQGQNQPLCTTTWLCAE